MGAKPIYIPHYTYDDYRKWEGRWELIQGVPVAMSPLPTPQHQTVGGNLHMIFKQALKDRCGHCKAFPPIDWKISEDTVVQPDFLVVCNKISKAYLDFPPVLVAEILSPSTAIKDRNAKFSIYEAQKVKYYLILNPISKKLEVYMLVNDTYQLVVVTPESWNFEIHDGCSITVSFSELWD